MENGEKEHERGRHGREEAWIPSLLCACRRAGPATEGVLRGCTGTWKQQKQLASLQASCWLRSQYFPEFPRRHRVSSCQWEGQGIECPGSPLPRPRGCRQLLGAGNQPRYLSSRPSLPTD